MKYRPTIEHLEARLVPTGPAGGFTPSELRHAYGFDQLALDGAGQTIAIIGAYDAPNIASDLQIFDAQFGLPDPVFTKVDQRGGTAYPAYNQGWAAEATLDVEWAHAIAPGANILLVEADSTGQTDLYATIGYASRQPGVSVVSMSFGWVDNGTHTNDGAFATPTNHQGVTFVASSGDQGSAYKEYPSSSSNVVGVGGTELSLDMDGARLDEYAWGGSGIYPDVSYTASPCAIYFSNYLGWLSIAGTSVGAPQWAGLIALANQGRAQQGKGSLDGVKQTIPYLQGMDYGNFFDVVDGAGAAPGVDSATGLGSPNANLLVPDLIADVPEAQIPFAIQVTPATVKIGIRKTQQFSAQLVDQLGRPMYAPGPYQWTCNGFGTITQAGLYTAPGSAGATTVQAWIGSIIGSAQVTVVTLPKAPSTLRATADVGQVSLTWKDNATNEDGFVLQISTDGHVWTALDSVDSNVTSYLASGLVSGRKYWFRAAAFNAAGQSGWVSGSITVK